ncbi:hypothetical protein LWC33_13030 [Pseudonocardia sp. RS11V-5]|nr:hypothetical protein [Pseudonocardia terrae]MCE3552381.1 hypothetical protein [Pseudonocardia terrae]
MGQQGDDLDGDINGDGAVNLTDMSILLSNWETGGADGSTCTKPES